jgi:copper chaperone CopZ
MLGQLWHAVEKGKGIPTKLVTAEATYTLVRPAIDQAEQSPAAGAPIVVTIDNMHCQGCANKIAGQISTLKGVTKVSIDMEGGLLVVETSRNIQLSPWAVIDAVAKANERPLAVVSSQGEMTIEWVAEAAPKDHEQAQQPRSEGIQR